LQPSNPLSLQKNNGPYLMIYFNFFLKTLLNPASRTINETTEYRNKIAPYKQTFTTSFGCCKHVEKMICLKFIGRRRLFQCPSICQNLMNIISMSFEIFLKAKQ
jgi:hypothetical protein